MDLKEKVESFPSEPGVYLMKNKEGRVVYVGKANSLKSRVSSYFRDSGDTRYFVRFLLVKVTDIDFIVTDTEKEAFILENNLIKKYKPRYNIRFKDDKTYVSLRLGVKDKYPRLTIMRRPVRDGALYFGPYASGQAVRKTLRTIHKIFPICTCSDSVFRNRTRACLYYQIGRCLAPCIDGMTTETEYRDIVNEVVLFLEGKNKELLKKLKEEMKKESKNLRYEEAGKIYRKIQAIEETLEVQKVTSYRFMDQDIFGFSREDDRIAIHRLYVRDGKLQGGKADLFPKQILPDEEILGSYLSQYYTSEKFIPKEILLSLEIDNKDVLTEFLSDKKEERVRILCPKRGRNRELVRMAEKNAEISLKRVQGDIADRDELLRDLQKSLYLRNMPGVIEAFDISNIRGENAVGSMVTFKDTVADKSRYKRFSIKWVEGIDDYGMMMEILKRRYEKGLKEEDLPDLILVDGGKGQLNVACRALNELGIHEPDIISLAKGENQDKKERDYVYIPERKNPIILKGSTKFLLQRIRDEAHRFAITYHKKKRAKELTISILDTVPGIGKKKKAQLLKSFGSLKKIREADVEEIVTIGGIDRKTAAALYQTLHQK
jgi:excinuclease ABC subunit C